jgi:hypothetical protein
MASKGSLAKAGNFLEEFTGKFHKRRECISKPDWIQTCFVENLNNLGGTASPPKARNSGNLEQTTPSGCDGKVCRPFTEFFYRAIQTAKKQVKITGLINFNKKFLTNPNSAAKTVGFGFFVFARLT